MVKIKLHKTRAVFASSLEGQIKEGLSDSFELYSSSRGADTVLCPSWEVTLLKDLGRSTS